MIARLSPSHWLRRIALRLIWLSQPLAGLLLLFSRLVPEPVAPILAWPVCRFSRLGKKQITLSRARLLLGADSAPALRPGQFWRDHLMHLSRNIAEPVYFFHLPDDKLVARVSLEGAEHLKQALASGRGAVLFLNHLGNPGAIVAGLGLRGYDLTIAGNPMIATVGNESIALDYLERIVQRMFARGHVRRALLGDRLPQRVAETLSRNGLFAMFIDFPVGRKHNQSVAFGAARMNVNLGPAILALRHRVPVLPVTCIRAGPKLHRLVVHPPLEIPAGSINTAAAQLLQSALARLLPDLREHPEQWWPWDWAPISAAD